MTGVTLTGVTTPGVPGRPGPPGRRVQHTTVMPDGKPRPKAKARDGETVDNDAASLAKLLWCL